MKDKKDIVSPICQMSTPDVKTVLKRKAEAIEFINKEKLYQSYFATYEEQDNMGIGGELL